MISVANVLHSENPTAVEDDWIEEYQLEEGNVDVIDVELAMRVHSLEKLKFPETLRNQTIN